MEVPELANVYSHVRAWHGTGRYAYRDDKVIDILQGIISAGALVPNLDDWDQKRGESRSISTTHARMYARLYAELYRTRKDRNIIKAIRPRFVWSAYFFLTSKFESWREYSLFKPHILNFKEKTIRWTQKLAKKPQTFSEVFLVGGTDIESNYPILIGIRIESIHQIKGSRFIDLHECRSTDSIPIKYFTHIEVPDKNIQETRFLLDQAGIQLLVMPIEAGDKYCLRFPFKVLANGQILTPALYT